MTETEKIENVIRAVSSEKCAPCECKHSCNICDYNIILAALKEQAERENPKPLTLDEMKQMNGEPVWTVTNGVDGSGRWELIAFTTLCASPFHQVITMTNLFDGQTDYEIGTYGKTWTAYRYKLTKEGE